jgi:hypothetical protein
METTKLSGFSRHPSDSFWVAGTLCDDPEARAFAAVAHRLVEAYATDVVHRFGLCPFFQNAHGGLGEVCVVLETKLDVERGLAVLEALASPIVHLVYPVLTEQASPPFERFGSALAQASRRALRERYVHANFHPSMVGGVENPHRLVGLLRQSPDPFVQFIPEGLSSSSQAEKSETPPIERTFARLMTDDGMKMVTERIETLRREREARDEQFNSLRSRVDVPA